MIERTGDEVRLGDQIEGYIGEIEGVAGEDDTNSVARMILFSVADDLRAILRGDYYVEATIEPDDSTGGEG